MTVAEAADAVGVKDRQFHRYQQGVTLKNGKPITALPPLHRLQRIAAVFGVPLTYFVEAEDEAATFTELAEQMAALIKAVNGVEKLLQEGLSGVEDRLVGLLDRQSNLLERMEGLLEQAAPPAARKAARRAR